MIKSGTENDIALTMAMVLATMFSIVYGLVFLQIPQKSTSATASAYYPCQKAQPSKYAYEMYNSYYTPIWIAGFAVIVIFQLYEQFDAATYNIVTIILALPFLLQPLLFPSAFHNSPDTHRPFLKRYATKANLWIAIYSFIGNYWYTHYFYSVLKAKYSMPATRLNNVPIAMFFATHFYFSSYHVFSNLCLRKIKTSFQGGWRRRLLYISTVIVLSYFTAFMETLTISSFPYYSFEDRDMAYKLGSAFYGIYFLVSFPAFLEFDEAIDCEENKGKEVTLWDTVVQSCGYGMIILCLLDFVRLQVGVPLIVGSMPS